VKPLAEARLYGIIDLGYVAAGDAPDAAEKLVAGGADIVQLRAKHEGKAAIASLAEKIHARIFPSGVPLILNDFPELLRDIPAEGAHVGQGDMPVAAARAAAGRPVIIGKSTHSPSQARAAVREGADYIGFGPLFATPTKPGRPAIGLDDIAAVNAEIPVPVFCIGGIKNEKNLPAVIAAGARRVVIVSGWLQAPDITAAVRATRNLLQ